MADTDTITAEIIALADEGCKWFTTDTRDDGTKFVKTRDEQPQWLEDLIFTAHGDMLPDDWRYSFIRDALSTISDASEGSDSQEVCDEYSEPDIYTNELTSWLGSRNDRYGYCDEAVEDLGAHDVGTIERIGLGQMMEKREVFYSVAQSLAERAEELADAEESDDDD
jgi:hypothetical protein